MSTRHPIITVTGVSVTRTSGAATSVKHTFDQIFRREGLRAATIEGDAFHRFDRDQMRAATAMAQSEGHPHLSHFGPEGNLLRELESVLAEYGRSGSGRTRHYVHDHDEAERYGCPVGTFTEWEPLLPVSDLLFYEGLHGAATTGGVDIARHADLKIGVVPVVNLEWIQKIHRDGAASGHSAEATTDAIVRRMPDYARHICPQFTATDVNFQRVPLVDTSNPFIARAVPTADESLVVIRFRDPRGVDFRHLLAMVHDSFMSRTNSIVIPGGKLDLAMQLILTPMIQRLVDRRRRAAA